MPSFQDSAVIFILALLLFGPKKLPELARQLGKLMGEFRRASAEFRMQMEDELRVSEQADRQKQIAAIEAAAPVAPTIDPGLPGPDVPTTEPEHPHLPGYDIYNPPEATEANGQAPAHAPSVHEAGTEATALDSSPSSAQPLPIASSGSLNLMPPSTGLPVQRTAGRSIEPAPVTSAEIFANIPAADEAASHSHAPVPFSDNLPTIPSEAHTIHTPDPQEAGVSTHG